jgi:hypothetical protein
VASQRPRWLQRSNAAVSSWSFAQLAASMLASIAMNQDDRDSACLPARSAQSKALATNARSPSL